MDIVLIFYKMKIYFVFSLESPDRGVLISTHNIPFFNI